MFFSENIISLFSFHSDKNSDRFAPLTYPIKSLVISPSIQLASGEG